MIVEYVSGQVVYQCDFILKRCEWDWGSENECVAVGDESVKTNGVFEYALGWAEKG